MKQNRKTQNRKWKQTIQSKTTLGQIWKIKLPTRFLYIVFKFFIFPERFPNNKESKKKEKKTKKEEKQMLLGHCDEKKYLEFTLLRNLQWDMRKPWRSLVICRLQGGILKLPIHFEKCSTQEKLFHDLGYVLLWNSGSEYTTTANNLREYLETSATSFTQYKTRCKICEIEEKDWKKCKILNEV